MATTLNALWPTITTRRAAVSAALISATTTLSAAFLYFLLERNTIAEHGTLARLFPALLMVIAWRTWRLYDQAVFALVGCTGRTKWEGRRWRLDISDPVHVGFMGGTQSIDASRTFSVVPSLLL